MKRLYRNKRQGSIGGVCHGIADYFGIDPTLVRLLWAVAFFVFGSGFLAYIIAWIVIPEEPF
ncbi:MAG: PspC domain-containing protein [Turicibacter sp.]|nr:PspC domain-containing protein [Turicibacter sp.]